VLPLVGRLHPELRDYDAEERCCERDGVEHDRGPADLERRIQGGHDRRRVHTVVQLLDTGLNNELRNIADFAVLRVNVSE